ncbi:MAG: hypothetical protein NVS9B2_16690 [Steroidobacteraceae bacterium]
MIRGKWNITIKTPMGDKSGVLELESTGTALTGSLSDAEHFAVISEGKIDGDRLSWSAKLTKPVRMKFKFTAVVEANRISGTATHLLGRVTFTGTRVEERAGHA